MNTSPPSPEGQRSSISLSRLATIFAVTFAIAFGLCSVSAMAVVGDNQKIAARLIWTSVSIEAICFVGLVVVGLIAILRR